MLVLGYLTLGGLFASTTLASTFLIPLFIELCGRVLQDFVLTEDIFLCALFSGLGIGISLGLVIRAGGSTGGMDIPPLMLNKYFRAPVSVTMTMMDVCSSASSRIGSWSNWKRSFTISILKASW